MLEVALVFCLCQRLDLEPYVAHPGDEVTLTATDGGSRPVRGVVVRVREPGREPRAVGTTDGAGQVRFVAEAVGPHEFQGRFPDDAVPLVIVTYHVVAHQRRWLYAVVLTPLGLALLWWNLRRLGKVRSGSSPPAA